MSHNALQRKTPAESPSRDPNVLSSEVWKWMKNAENLQRCTAPLPCLTISELKIR